MIKRILVGYDGSDEAQRATLWAAELARITHARLDLVAVARPPEIAADVETEAHIQQLRAVLAKLLTTMRAQLSIDDERIATHLLVGHPAERLLRFAEEHHVDHLVVGHRSRGALQRWLLGSVARHVMDHAPCSVTIVR